MAKKHKTETVNVNSEAIVAHEATHAEAISPMVGPINVGPVNAGTEQTPIGSNAVATNRVWHLRELNYRLSLGSQTENGSLRGAMVEQGRWAPSAAVMVFRELPDPRYTHEKLVELSMHAMRVHHEMLKTEALNKAPGSLEATTVKAFEARWWNPATNSYHVPDLFGGTGFRRGNKVLDEVNGILMANDRPMIDRMYVTLMSFKSMEEFRLYQRMENESAKAGSMEVPMIDRLRSAQTEWQRIFTGPSSIVKMGFAYGTAQTLFNILKLNDMYPDLRIIERIYLPSNDPMNLPINRFHKETMRPFVPSDVRLKKGMELQPKEKLVELLGTFRDAKQAPSGVTKPQLMTLETVYGESKFPKAFAHWFKTGDYKPVAVWDNYMPLLDLIYDCMVQHVPCDELLKAIKPVAIERKVLPPEATS